MQQHTLNWPSVGSNSKKVVRLAVAFGRCMLAVYMLTEARVLGHIIVEDLSAQQALYKEQD